MTCRSAAWGIALATCCGATPTAWCLTDPPLVPAMHRRIPNPVIEADSTLGWTGAFGNIDDPLGDSLDDLVLASIELNHRDAAGTFFADLGAGFAFTGLALQAVGPSSLLPEPPFQSDLKMGQLDVVIGDLRGTAASPRANLVCFGATANSGDYPGCPAGQPRSAGSVEIFDLSAPTPVRTSLRPPLESLPCGTGARGFGNGVAIGHVDNDAFLDLVVGAPNSDDGFGRVYVFFGHAGFFAPDGPLLRWTAFKAPGLPTDPPFNMGYDVQVVDFDGDGSGEIVAGAPNRETSDGRAYVFKGARVAALATSVVHDGTAFGAGELQTILPPASILEDDPSMRIAFGWQVFAIGDMVGSEYGTGNGRPDVAIHSEGGKWLAPPGPYDDVPNAGAVVVYAAWDPVDGVPPAAQPFVKVPGTKLQTPLVWEGFEVPGGFEERLVHMPQSGARYGRGLAPVEWRTQSGAVVRGLIVGEPNADVHDPSHPSYPDDTPVQDAGRVFFLKAPLDAGTNATTNAWGEVVLLEPNSLVPEWQVSDPKEPMDPPSDFGPQPGAKFGAWIGSGQYSPLFVAKQVFISARERSLKNPSGTPLGRVGQVYTCFVPQ